MSELGNRGWGWQGLGEARPFMKQTHRCCNYSNGNRTGSIGGHSLEILTLCVEFFVTCRPRIHLLLQHEKEQHHLRIQIPSQGGNLHYIAWTKGSIVTLLFCRGGTKLQLLVITKYPSPVLQYFASLPALLPSVLSFQISCCVSGCSQLHFKS